MLKEIEELQHIQDEKVREVCQYVNMRLISLDIPELIGKRVAINQNKTHKQDIISFYQQNQGFSIFIHPVDFSMIEEAFDELPKNMTAKVYKVIKATKGSFSKQNWSTYTHLGKNSDIVLVHVELKSLLPHFDKGKYFHKLKMFENANKGPKSVAQKKSFEVEMPKYEEELEVVINKKKTGKPYRIRSKKEEKLAAPHINENIYASPEDLLDFPTLENEPSPERNVFKGMQSMKLPVHSAPKPIIEEEPVSVDEFCIVKKKCKLSQKLKRKGTHKF